MKADITSRLKTTLRAFRSRNYRLYFGGQIISLTGTWIQSVAMSWLVYGMTHSAFLLGLVSFFGMIPVFFSTPFAGVLVDRVNRHRLLVVTQALAMLQAFILAFLTLTDMVTVEQIIVLSLCLGFINALDAPARQSFVVYMVDRREDLGNAIALNSALFNSARLIGPTIAGALIALAGEGICFLINGASYIAVIAALLLMDVSSIKTEPPKNHAWHDLKQGFLFAYWCVPIRVLLINMALLSLMGMSYLVLMPVFAKDLLHGDSHTLGFLVGASGTGALLAAVHLASRKNPSGLWRFIAGNGLVFGSGLVVLSLYTVFWVSLPLMFVTGFCLIAQMASTNIILQSIVPDELRGRIMSLFTLAMMGVAPFGSLLVGFLADRIGAAVTLLAGGCACLAAAVVFSLMFPGWREEASRVCGGRTIPPGAVVEAEEEVTLPVETENTGNTRASG